MEQTLREPALRLDNLSMYYHSGELVVPGVVHVDLSFSRGEFVVITGESGAGKSTLLNVLSALCPYHEGEMYVSGQPTSAFDSADWEEYRRAHIGFVFQSYNLIESYTALQNVVCARLMRGESEKEALKNAPAYLEKVGLSAFASRRAAKLSSGQKQRLAIARALAKETDIIIADEPTGNLDSENGRQIMELLSALSRDRLVVMVSHNIEEALPYATRIIRMHDGRVSEDRRVRPPHEAGAALAMPQKLPSRVLAGRFARLGRRAQPARSLLTLLVFFAVALASFVFFGTFLANMDDTPAKVYNDEAFRNGDPTRLAVRRSDGEPLTQDDLAYFYTLAHVVQADRYDAVADVNYYADEGTDYVYRYNTAVLKVGAEVLATETEKSVILQNETRFIRTADCLHPANLAEGRLPEAVCEIACYGRALGDTLTVWFADRPNWGVGQSADLTVTVVGVLAEPDTQIYFSQQFGAVLGQNAIEWTLLRAGCHTTASSSFSAYTPLVIADDSLSGNEAAFAGVMLDPSVEFAGSGYIGMTTDGGERLYGETFTDSREAFGGMAYCQWTLAPAAENDCSYRVVKVSTDYFLDIFPDYDCMQGSVYLEDYAYTDDVLRALNHNGYRAVSPFRIGSLTYDAAKVKQRMTTLLVALAALIAALLLESPVLFAVLRLRRNDFAVLKTLGMDQGTVRRVNTREIFPLALAGIALAAAAVALLWTQDFPYMLTIARCFRWWHAPILLLLNLLAAWLPLVWLNRYFDKQLGGGNRLAPGEEAA